MAKNQKKKNKKGPVLYMSRPLWYVLLISGIVTLICAVFLIGRWCLNAYYVAEAEKGRYHVEIEERLTRLNFPDGYVVWYNLGNYYYREGDYEKAETAYYRAIECGIPYEKECPVKVNLALAMIEQLSDEEWEAFFDEYGTDHEGAQARNVENTLVTARSILIEDGCAHEDDEDGHNEEAQILKDEIDELLALDQDDEEDDEDDDGEDEDDSENDDGQDGNDNQSPTPREEDIMDHIQDQKEEAQQERAEDRQFYENYYGFGDEDSEGGSGYSAEETGEIW